MKLYTLVVFIVSGFFYFTPMVSYAQEDLEKLMQENEKPTKEYVTATFKGTRLINLHTVETLGRRTLEFRISHRFGDMNTGANNLYGLEGPAYIRLALEYSHNGRLMFGLGRSSSGKLIDGFAKYRILRQTVDNSMPLSITIVGSANLSTSPTVINVIDATETYSNFSQRLAYMTQLIIGRKFTKSLSLQVSPIYIHYNLVGAGDKNDMFAIGFSGRYKFTKRMALTAEYIMRINNNYSSSYSNYYNSAGVGIDIETGGHVFQLFVTNSYALNEVLLIPYTSTSWSKGGIRLGFNISRSFNFNKKPKAE